MTSSIKVSLSWATKGPLLSLFSNANKLPHLVIYISILRRHHFYRRPSPSSVALVSCPRPSPSSVASVRRRCPFLGCSISPSASDVIHLDTSLTTFSFTCPFHLCLPSLVSTFLVFHKQQRVCLPLFIFMRGVSTHSILTSTSTPTATCNYHQLFSLKRPLFVSQQRNQVGNSFLLLSFLLHRLILNYKSTPRDANSPPQTSPLTHHNNTTTTQQRTSTSLFTSQYRN